ncbi:hypothetical protein ACFWMH_21895 [Streptomyces tendae]|uniref:hypothetical protein n=1 Tax=Streptomyces tendae TaxID=1932 RepID=UPI00365911E4
MSYPTLFTTPGVRAFAEEIDAERQRQLAKFGDQHHPDGTGPRTAAIVGMLCHADDAATYARAACQAAARRGETTWRLVFAEEVLEALAESDPTALRAELVQVAAVCAAWIADLDSREHGEQPAVSLPPADQTAEPERRERYKAAIREADGWVLDDGQHMVDAVMAVADAELAEARTQAANLRTMYNVADARTNDLIEERDQLLEARADRAAVLREAADEIAGIDFHPNARARSLDIAAGLARRLRRMADETQPAETEDGDCDDCGRALCRDCNTHYCIGLCQCGTRAHTCDCACSEYQDGLAAGARQDGAQA